MTGVLVFSLLSIITANAAAAGIKPAADDINAALFPTLAPTVAFQSARVVHRVKFNNRWWMRLHVKSRIKGGLSTPCKMYAYFYNDEDGEPLEAAEGYPKYTTADGYASASSADFTPSLNDAVYNDLQIYVPYEVLNLETEKGSEYDLKYYLTVRDEYRKRIIARSGWYMFRLRY